MTNRHWKKL